MKLRLGKDKQVINIFIINGLIVFVYAILFSSLTINLTDVLSFDVRDAQDIVGLFLALNFIIHLLAGYLGGRFISNRQILLISGVMQLAGTILLSHTTKNDVFLGLSLVVIGCGLNSTSLQCILTSKFEKDSPHREAAFFWMYSSLNAGFLIGMSTAGFYDLSASFSSLYILASGVVLFSILWIVLSWNALNEEFNRTSKTNQRYRAILGSLALLCLIPLCDAAFKHPDIGNKIILSIGVAAVVSILSLAKKTQDSIAKNSILAFFILTFFSIIFWALFYIGPLGGVVFLEKNVQLTILGLNVAPQWLMNLNSIFIILGSPLMSKLIINLRGRGASITTPKQFLASLVLIALSYFVYSIGIYFCNDHGKTGMIWVVFHYILQASGELLIAPVGYAMVGELIPRKHQGYMMGIWMMVSGIAVELSTIFSHYMSTSSGTDQVVSNHIYISVFNKLGAATLVLAALLLLALRFLEGLINPTAQIGLNDKSQTKKGSEAYSN